MKTIPYMNGFVYPLLRKTPMLRTFQTPLIISLLFITYLAYENRNKLVFLAIEQHTTEGKIVFPIVMPLTLKKLMGHIAFGA